MYITTRTYTATQAVARQFEYACAHCGVRATAGVEATATAQSKAVYGVGGSADSAARSAHALAEHNAIRALREAPCPQCGRYQPALEARYRAYADGVARTKRRRLPLAALVALVVLGLGLRSAIRDLSTSNALLVTMLLASATGFSFALAGFGSPPTRPTPPSARVHFWWGSPDGSVGWRPPPSVPLPSIPAHPVVHVLGIVAGGLLALATMISLGAYSSTFEKVYVIDTGTTPIRIDSVDVTNDVVSLRASDGNYRQVSVRTGKDHRLELAGVAYALGKEAPNGWLVVPDAVAQERCFSEEESIYGTSEDEPKYGELTPKNGVVVLPRSYTNVFDEPRKQVLLRKNETVRHVWSLRSHPCAETTEDDR
jgi:hypothetical protein